MNLKAVIFFLVLIAFGLSAQQVKKIEAVKVSQAPVVNGYPDDAIWKDIPAAKNFVQYEPSNGKSATFDTEVKFASSTPGQNRFITENASETQIINAVKLSGRTNSGLGIGFFNAVTSNTYAEIKNSSTGSDREVLTQPATNYNIIVLDQSFDDNKFTSLINTNLYRPGTGYMANVTGSEFPGQLREINTYQRTNKK